MHRSNFLKIFKTFDKKEAINFEKYLLVTFPGEKVAFSLFKYIQKYHPEFQYPVRLEIKYAYKIIFPADADVNPKKISNALSQLSGWAKEFLLIEKIKSDSIERELLLGGILKKRKLQWDFLNSTVKLEHLLANISKSSVEDYLYYLRASYKFIYQKESKGMSETVKNLNDVTQAADIAYALIKIKMACAMESYNHFGSTQTEIKDMEIVLQIADRYVEDVPFLQLYCAVYQLVFQKTNENFTTAVNLLSSYASMLNTDEIHDILSLLRNYLGKRIAGGDEEIWEKGQELNEISLVSEYFKKEKLTGVGFSNIVNIACGVNRIEWAQQFINEVGPSLAESIREDTVTIAKVSICAAQKDYESILEVLGQYHFRDVKLNIIARSFTLKSYYMLRKTPEEILFQCNAFTSYLNRQTTLNKDFLDPASNFIKMVKLLDNPNKTRKTYLTQLEKHKPVLMYKWLKEMSPAR